MYGSNGYYGVVAIPARFRCPHSRRRICSREIGFGRPVSCKPALITHGLLLSFLPLHATGSIDGVHLTNTIITYHTVNRHRLSPTLAYRVTMQLHTNDSGVYTAESPPVQASSPRGSSSNGFYCLYS